MKLVNKSIAVLGFLLLLSVSGCMTPEQQRQYAQNIQNEKINKCTSYGFKQGTTAFAQCMMKLDQDAAKASDCATVALAAYAAAKPSEASFEMARARNDCEAGRPVQAQRKPINTQCTSSGNTVNCTSN
jgi:hypothetical protein